MSSSNPELKRDCAKTRSPLVPRLANKQGGFCMSYRITSNWNNKNEILCLIIFKKLEAAKFPRGMQMEYCREMSLTTKLKLTSVNAKVGNYKSVARVIRPSNASKNTVEI